MTKYSFFSLAWNAISHHENWPRVWRSPEPKAEYDVVIVGAGGHGLATAYYLAKEHRITNVAVLEKGWLGGGSVGRNTTIVRSNYLWDETAHLYEMSLKLWEGLSQELNYNVMFSQRGVLNLAHSLGDLRELSRRVHANRLHGIDAELLDVEQIKKMVPCINTSSEARYPILGASLQRRGGHRPPRCGRLGLRARRRSPRRRHHSALCGNRDPARGRPGARRRYRPRFH